VFAATALLTTGVAESDLARREFLDRVQTESERVLEQALVERDAATAGRALYLSALYDQVYRPDEALDSWSRLLPVLADNFDHRPVHSYLGTPIDLDRSAIGRSFQREPRDERVLR
jgi:hypothetical protein